ncbi:MAG TPA: histidine kinase, partial [Ruminococcaceae bacterium]|nr:histidine kinase [Oscillospiraceae bacterium]
CREKAIAVLQGKADIRMCIPYMRELAESMSNAVVENSPTSILILNASLNIEQFNPSAKNLLHLDETSAGQPIRRFLPSPDFEQVLTSGKNILNHKQNYKNLNLIVKQTVVLVENSHFLFVLLEDITREEQNRENQRRTAEETVAFANEAVDRQMRAVQEIANLLGETTSETEVALRQLTKNIISKKGEDNGRSN